MRKNFRISVKRKMTIASIKMISVLVCISAFISMVLSESDPGFSSLRRSSYASSSDFVNPFKSRGASLRGRKPNIGASPLRDAAPFPFRHMPKSLLLRSVPDSFFYDPQVSPPPVHLRRQRQQFQNIANERDPILSPAVSRAPNHDPIVQIKELPPRNVNPQNLPTIPNQPFSRRTHPLIAASLDDSTVVRLQEISQLPQTSPFPTASTPTLDTPQSPPQISIKLPSNDDILSGTAMSFAKFTHSGQNIFNHQIHPTATSNRKPTSSVLSRENVILSSFNTPSKIPDVNVQATTKQRILLKKERIQPLVEIPFEKFTTEKVLTQGKIGESLPVPPSTSPGSAFPTVNLNSGLGVRVTERAPIFAEELSNQLPRSRGSTPDTIAKLRQQHLKTRFTTSFPAVPASTLPPVINRAREPRVFSAVPTTVKSSTAEQESTTTFSTPTTSLFAHLRQRPLQKHTQLPSGGTTRSASGQRRIPQATARQNLLRAITERLR